MIDKIFSKFRTIINKSGLGKKGILAFDLGSYSIKIVEVQIIKDEPVITNFVQGKTYIPSEEEIRNKINEDIPYKIDDVYYSYYIIPKKDFYQIFYLVAKKEVIEQYESLVNNLYCQANNIDADFINLHNLTETLYGEKPKIIIDWGDSKIKLLFCADENPVYSRELFNLGLKNLRKNLIKNLKLDADTAEALVVNPEKSSYFETKEIYKNYIEDVIREIETTLKFVKEKFNLTPENIFLVGGGARIPNICEIFSNALKIETRLIDLNKNIKFSNNFDPDYIKVVNTQGAIAAATALRDFI
jgi:type IV pilus assembly protein PilM